MMNPARKNTYWYTWTTAAETSPAAKKLIDRLVQRPAMEFYDLQKDPYELNNLAGDPSLQPMIKSFNSKLKAWMEQQGDEGASIDIDYKKDKTEAKNDQ
jgi:hypothetical protein